jgi:succinate dehydrogenase / fumarate reductase flavoprotein subunit
MTAPFDCQGGENPYAIHADLEDCMQELVGIIRTESELLRALGEIEKLRARAAGVTVQGNRQFNPGWHLALDLHCMLTVAEAVTRAALERKESRGGHTRDDHPGTDAQLAKVNVVTRRSGEQIVVTQEPLPAMPDDLRRLVEEGA